MNLLSAQLTAFCSVLRDDHSFPIGPPEARDALRAIDVVGVTNRDKICSALRLVCCTSPAQRPVFDRAFAEFFSTARPGMPQPAHAARHSRPGRAAAENAPAAPQPAPRERTGQNPDDDAGAPPAAAQRRPAAEDVDVATQWQALRARLSPHAARGGGLYLDVQQAVALRPSAERIVRNVRLGRSRRWKAFEHGHRFDIRRTVRASLQTGGDPIALRFLGHPPRHPRFVVLIDGSRSMDEHAALALAFAAALCDRTPRAHVFTFSTALRDITRELRAALLAPSSLDDAGEAWGGGTQIGASLAQFVATHGSRLLSADTLVLIFSDGLDAGDVAQLERAMRELDRRSAGVVWLNPLAATPGYRPSARGIRAALPFIKLYGCANDAAGFAMLANRLMQAASLFGR